MNDIKPAAGSADMDTYSCVTHRVFSRPKVPQTQRERTSDSENSVRDAEHKVDLFYNDREENNYCKFN